VPILEYLESAVVEALGADTVCDLTVKGVHLTFTAAVQPLVGASH
jgi:hypothetical protein